MAEVKPNPINRGALRIGNAMVRSAKMFRKGISASYSLGRDVIRRSNAKIKSSQKKIDLENKSQRVKEKQTKEATKRQVKENQLEVKKVYGAVAPVRNIVRRAIMTPLDALMKLIAAWAVQNIPLIIKKIRTFVKKVRIAAASINYMIRSAGSVFNSLIALGKAIVQNAMEFDFTDESKRVEKAKAKLDEDVESVGVGFDELKNVWNREEAELDKMLESLENQGTLKDAIEAALPNELADTTQADPQTPLLSENSGVSAPSMDPSQQQAFKLVYDLAEKHGAKFPEVAAAQAMQETGWLKNPNSVYFMSGKTNPFGQSVELANKSGWAKRGIVDYVSTPTAGGGERYWAVYKDFEAGVKDHVNLWHKSRPSLGVKNYNDFDTAAEGVRSIIDDYSPDEDPDNIKRGFKESDYSSNVLRFITDAGIDPMGGSGQDLSADYATATLPETKAKPPTQIPQPASTAANSGVGKATDAQGMTLGSNVLYDKDFNTTDRSVPSPIIKTSSRGMRNGRHHGGIDFAPPSGQTGWYCALKANGKVTFVGTLSGYGNTVIIQVGNVDLLFAHLARYSPGITNGSSYTAGQPIGEVGNTGRSTGIHLHFEARPVGAGGGSDIDPSPYVKILVFGRLKKTTQSNNTNIASNPQAKSQEIASAAASRRTNTPGQSQNSMVVINQVQRVIT